MAARYHFHVVPPRTTVRGAAVQAKPSRGPKLLRSGLIVERSVIDPFFGAGTTGLVASRLGRHCIGIELNPDYARLAHKRLKEDGGMFEEVHLPAAPGSSPHCAT